jgi:hypothetical protein
MDKKKTHLKPWLWHVIAVAFFLLLSVTYFSPVVFQGKGLQQVDIMSSHYIGKDARDHYAKTGEYSFWSNTMFSGLPGNAAGGMPSSFNINGIFARVFALFTQGYTLRLLLLYMMGFYIFLLSIGCKPWLGIIGAVAYALATYNLLIIDAGHGAKCCTMATFAPVLGGVIMTYRGKYLWGALVTLIFTGMNVAWSHQQISYYLMLTIGIMVVVYFVYALTEKQVKRFFVASAILAATAAVAVLPSVGSLATTMDYTKETMRGGAVLQKNNDQDAPAKKSNGLDIDYAYAWSYGKMETFTLLIPNMMGASSHYDLGTKSATYDALRQSGQAAQFVRHAPMYWGDQPFTSGPVYAGAIICLLFFLGLYLVPEKEKWWLLLATMLSVFLAWGRHFPLLNEFFFYHLPLYNKFRTPSMALIIANITMVIMAALTLKALVEQSKTKGFITSFKRPFLVSLCVTAGTCLLFFLFGSVVDMSAPEDVRYPDWLVKAMQQDRLSMLRSDALRSLFFIGVAAALIWYWAKGKIKLAYFAAALGMLILIDLWQVDKRFLNNNTFVAQKAVKTTLPSDVDKQILQDPDPNYRVLNLASNTFNEARTSYFHKSIGGYSPAKLRRYQDIIDYCFTGKNLNMQALNMLNTRYFILADKQSGKEYVQRNPDAMGNAWLVDSIRWVNSPNEEIEALSAFDAHREAIIDTMWKPMLMGFLPFSAPKNADGLQRNSIALDSILPGYLSYTSSSDAARLAVFSEVYYKTWRAYVDGVETPLVRANYILRAAVVPAGVHRVELRCRDDLALRWVMISNVGSGVVAAAVLLLLGGIVVDERRRRMMPQPEPPKKK